MYVCIDSVPLITAMLLEEISFNVPTCPDSPGTEVDLSSFSNVIDDVLGTCDVISRPDITYIEVIWRFGVHNSYRNREYYFRVVVSGSQNCLDVNVSWFVSAETLATISECRTSQKTTGEFKECQITCQCSYAECEYLHFRVQIPAWMRRTLAICHFELYYTVELPFVFV